MAKSLTSPSIAQVAASTALTFASAGIPQILPFGGNGNPSEIRPEDVPGFPPGWVFGVVWTALYILIGISGAFAYANRSQSAQGGVLYGLYWALLAGNFGFILASSELVYALLGLFIVDVISVLYTANAFALGGWIGWLTAPLNAWAAYASYLITYGYLVERNYPTDLEDDDDLDKTSSPSLGTILLFVIISFAGTGIVSAVKAIWPPPARGNTNRISPVFQPPAWFFVVMWLIVIYPGLGVSAAIAWTRGDGGSWNSANSLAMLGFLLHWIVNTAVLHVLSYRPLPSQWTLYSLPTLWVFGLFQAIAFLFLDNVAGFLAIPNVLWLTAATYLTSAEWYLRKHSEESAFLPSTADPTQKVEE